MVDLTQVLPGPFCTLLLADVGDDVVRVEPLGGDAARAWGQHRPTVDEPGLSYGGGLGSVNRNKCSVCLDLGPSSGREDLPALPTCWSGTSVSGHGSVRFVV